MCLQQDLDEMCAEARLSEDKARSTMIDAARYVVGLLTRDKIDYIRIRVKIVNIRIPTLRKDQMWIRPCRKTGSVSYPLQGFGIWILILEIKLNLVPQHFP